MLWEQHCHTPGQTHAVPQQDPGAEPAGCCPPLGRSHRAGATHPCLQAAPVQLQGPPYPNQLIPLLTSLRLSSIHINVPLTTIFQLRSFLEETSTSSKSPRRDRLATEPVWQAHDSEGSYCTSTRLCLGTLQGIPGGAGTERCIYLSHVQMGSTGTLLGRHLHVSHFVKN